MPARQTSAAVRQLPAAFRQTSAAERKLSAAGRKTSAKVRPQSARERWSTAAFRAEAPTVGRGSFATILAFSVCQRTGAGVGFIKPVFDIQPDRFPKPSGLESEDHRIKVSFLNIQLKAEFVAVFAVDEAYIFKL